MRIASDVTTVQGAQKSLLAAGHELSAPGRVSMRTHGYCDDPVFADLHTRSSSSCVNRYGGDRPYSAELLLPCRRCTGCRGYKARTLASAMEVEIQSAQRTWLLTLTMAPDYQLRAGGAQPLSDDYRTAWIREVQKYWKRVRKQTGAQLRYCCVLERHKSGLYHAHAVVHEYATRIPARILQGQWPMGFVRSTIVVDNYGRVGRYVAKYLVKEEGAWCKTSRSYGAPGRFATQNALSIAEREGVLPTSLRDPPRPSLGSLEGGSLEACSQEPACNGLYVGARKRSTHTTRPEETRLVEEGMADV